MKKRVLVIAFMLLAWLLLVSTLTHWGQKLNDEQEVLKQMVQERKDEIKKLESSAFVLLTLTILVAVFGASTAALHNLKMKGSKAVVVILGFAVTAITIINNTAFDKDHRAYSSVAHRARSKADEILIDIIRGYRPPDSDDARNKWFDRVQVKIHELDAILKSEEKIQIASIPFNLVINAYAQTQEIKEPSWLTKPPEDKFNLYFVGVGESNSLQKAEEYSLNDAVSSATEYLKSQFDIKEGGKPTSFFETRELAQYLAKSGSVKDTYFRYYPENKLFRFYTLFVMDRKGAVVNIKFFSIRQKTYVPYEFNQAVEKPQVLPEEYFVQRFSAKDNFLNLAKEKIMLSQYENYMEGHNLRISGQSEKAAELLEQVVRESPDYFFGWYDLALAYDGLKDFAKANQFFEKAAELEPTQPVRDGSFYIAYGDFLFRNQKYTEAIIELRKALEIDPNNQKIALTLKAAEKALER
jgi:tetratricopeptide (TPR) repeat protein